jgi:hypothetical protein
MLECKTAPLKMRTFEQFDGSQWRNYESEHAYFQLTEVGRKLIAANRLGRLLRHYAEDYREGREGPEDARRFIAEGGRGRVFGVGNTGLAVKEKRPLVPDSLFEGLNRMDKLVYAIRKHCPAWIDVPEHYGIVTLKEDLSKEFMLMQKVDEGVTVGDIKGIDDMPREKHLEEAVHRLHGPITEEFQEEVVGRYGMSLGLIRRALLAEYLSPDEYLPDLDHNPYNIVVERQDTPIDGSMLKYWVIDQ